jgi:peptide/nickel transport system permease protein
MVAYVARRLLYAVLTFFGITIATFTLIHSVPGDPIDFYLAQNGMRGSRPALEATRHELHLDRPLLAQYGYWVRGLVTLDLGRSIADRRPVTERIAEKLPATFELNFLAFLLAAGAGIPLGLWSATRPNGLLDRGSAVVVFTLYSLPTFWVALLLIQFFVIRHDWLPLLGMHSDEWRTMSAFRRFGDHLQHLVLPVITLTYSGLAVFARFSRSALTEVIREDFITTARAKGAPESAVIWHHALRNALIPLITLFGLNIPYLISGSVIVEQIFGWDGVGRLYLMAILSRDYPLVLGLTVATAVITLLAGLVSDLLYGLADPRIRLETRTR